MFWLSNCDAPRCSLPSAPDLLISFKNVPLDVQLLVAVRAGGQLWIREGVIGFSTLKLELIAAFNLQS